VSVFQPDRWESSRACEIILEKASMLSCVCNSGFCFLVPLPPHPTPPRVSLSSALMFFMSGVSWAVVIICVPFPGSRTACARTVQRCLDTSDVLQSHLPALQNTGCRCDQLLSAGCVCCVGASNSLYMRCFLGALTLPCRAVQHWGCRG